MKIKHLVLLSTTALLAACGGNNPATTSSATTSTPTGTSQEASSVVESSEISEESSYVPSEATIYHVTFNFNYEGSEDVVVDVEEGDLVSAPAVPDREGFGFAGWFVDEAGSEAFDFETAIDGDKTLYASWTQIDENTRVATFHLNDGSEDDVFAKVYFQLGSRLPSVPSDPVLDAHYFRGWYEEAELINKFNKMKKFDDNVDFYARWSNSYVFEAEYTQFTDLGDDDIDAGLADFMGNKIGHGYSSDVSGTGLIFADDDKADCKASNGYYVTDLYMRGQYLEFVINSDVEVNDAILIARLSAEYFDMTFTPENYIISVNGESINYGTIAITGVPSGRSTAKKLDFADFNLSTAITLHEGENKIRLTTNNSTRHDTTGTMAAEAPMVDCLKIHADADLVFTEYLNNI